MQYRLLFVAGMTVGVMSPLVWAAYVARPASHAAPAPAVKIAKASRATQKPAPVARKDVTGAIAFAPAVISAPQTTVHVMLPPPRPDVPTAVARASAKPAPSHLAAVRAARPHHARHRDADRYLPAVVDHYNGAHIITVCAALTVNEQLRAGCP